MPLTWGLLIDAPIDEEHEKYQSHFYEFIKRGFDPDQIEMYKKVYIAIDNEVHQSTTKEAQEVQFEDVMGRWRLVLSSVENTPMMKRMIIMIKLLIK